jgi:maleylacetate reductase
LLEFTYSALPGRVVFGAGVARTRLRDELAGRVLLIAGEPELELARSLAGDTYATFSEVRQHVPVEVAHRAAAAAEGADVLLSVGGGSTTGTAKAVALETGLPIVAVPTTYAGSEMTPVWGMTEASRKTTGRDQRVLPKVVLYDPELTVSLPASVTGPSALNAIAHCVEAFYGPGANPITSLMAEEGIRALARGVRCASPKTSPPAPTRSTARTSQARRSPPPARACTTRSATSSAARTTSRTPTCTA